MGNNNKVYYKVLDKNMKSPYRRFQYELNKTYSTDEKLEICENGFHACKNMYEMILYTSGYDNPKDCRFFECILGDIIIEDTYKVVSNSITLTKEIPYEEVDKSIRENIEVLVHARNYFTRKTVAEHGYGLDILINDRDTLIRSDVAKHGYGLDILINDKYGLVRSSVALQGYGLDILINDEDAIVRAVVASQGYGLDILIHDKDWHVRRAVAEQGYGLDILINDKDWHVRKIAKQMLNKEN